jgi:hypothetical protein
MIDDNSHHPDAPDRPPAKSTDYWESLSDESGGSDETGGEGENDRETVAQALADELGDADRLRGVLIHKQDEQTVTGVILRETSYGEIADNGSEWTVIDLRTLIVDTKRGNCTLTDNGLWLPYSRENYRALTKMVASGNNAQDSEGYDPLMQSTIDGLDTDTLFRAKMSNTAAQHVDKMERHRGIDPSRDWGYGGGAPPEVEKTAERLREAGLEPSEHLSRLRWGQKEPMDREPRPIDDLTGNYGIELLPRDSGLIALDIDYPDKFPKEVGERLPETLAVSSPHGDDRRRHLIYRCHEKKKLADLIGAWASQAVAWGDLWLGDRYLVGPGSQLGQYGCDNGFDRDSPECCEACGDPDRGYYRIVADRPIATVTADDILDLAQPQGSDGADRDEPARVRGAGDDPGDGPGDGEPAADGDESGGEGDESGGVRCDKCGELRPESGVKEVPTPHETRYICRGGCDN